MHQQAWVDLMNVTTAQLHGMIRASVDAGLSNEAAAQAIAIGVVSYIRAYGLPEEKILREARCAVPERYQREMLTCR